MPNIVIVGASGFVGANLVRRIYADPNFNDFDRLILIDPLQYGLQKIPPEILADPRTRFEKESIYTPGLVSHLVGRGDVVLHVAAQINTDYHPQNNVDDNPIRYLRELSDAKIGRLLFMSSSDLYGLNNSDDLTETHPVRPTAVYSAAKAAFEAFLSAFHASDGLPVVTMRPVSIYGPLQEPGWLVPVVITRALARKRITVYGDGSARRDWIHVDDICELLTRAALTDDESIHGEVFNLGTGVEHTVLDVIGHVLRTVGNPHIGIDYAAGRRGDPQRQVTSAAKARATFGWAPEVGLREGLQRTIAVYRQASTAQV
jgi:dTDP-glucose 4,6-dehydratase